MKRWLPDNFLCKLSLQEKCPYSKLTWSLFCCIRTEYGEIIRIYLYSVRMQGNTDQNNSEYGQFLRSVYKHYVYQVGTCEFLTVCIYISNFLLCINHAFHVNRIVEVH